MALKIRFVYTLIAVVSLLLGCSDETPPWYMRGKYRSFELPSLSAPQKYFILENRDGEPVLVTKCGGYSEIAIDGTTFSRQLCYQLSGARRYTIVKKDTVKGEKIILCKGSLIGPGYIDTNVRVRITYKDIDFRTTRFIIDVRGEDDDKKDTLYTTTMPFLSGYKVRPWPCNLKAQPLDSIKTIIAWWGTYTVD